MLAPLSTVTEVTVSEIADEERSLQYKENLSGQMKNVLMPKSWYECCVMGSLNMLTELVAGEL